MKTFDIFLTFSGLELNKRSKCEMAGLGFFSFEIYTINMKTTVIWHHDNYGCQRYKKCND